MVTVRPAIPTDIPAILRFIRALAEYELLTHACVATEDDLHQQLFGLNPPAEVLIGELTGTPVGFALFFTSFSTFLAKPGIYLEDLFVLESFRGKGVGKALLIHVAKIATDRNCGRLEWAVLDWNAPSIAFYKSVGAEPLDDWTTIRVTGDTLATLASGANS